MRTPSSIGIAAALALIGAWLVLLGVLLTSASLDAPSDILWAIPAVAVITFLHTGLFITAHDAMHGTVAPGRRRLNDGIGAVAVTLYALFSYKKLFGKHHEHHAAPGVPGHDPDFHDGEHRGFWRWYLHFFRGYVGLGQIVGMALVFNVLAHLVGIPEPSLVAFWVVPSLLSTVQLFYFGTYLPHRGPHAQDDPHQARSNDFAPWLSFLTCYHFGYHREHHEAPHVPWWKLPMVRGSAGPGSGG